MNHIYRLVWNETTRTWAAVAETAKGRGRRSGTTVDRTRGPRPAARRIAARMLAVSLAFVGLQAWAVDPVALPTGGQVMAGSATISQTANALTVQQASQRAVLNWQSFNIGAAASVNFHQPGASAVALNRIVGNEASQIYGKLNANGQVFFINPNGMLFAQGAQVNVGGLMATTLNIGNADFMAGNYRFTNPGSGSIRNEGLINATGSVVMMGNSVQNAGRIFATTATLAAGNTVALDLTGDGLIRARVEDAALKASVENSGSIGAARVTLTAGHSRDAINNVVNNTGMVRATGFASVGGEIVLEGGRVANAGTLAAVNADGSGGTVSLRGRDVELAAGSVVSASGTARGGSIEVMGDLASGSVRVAGMLDASAPVSGNGGFIETSAARVNIASDVKVTTAAAMGLAGTWLIDPVDFTIAASGGNMTGAALSSGLAGGNVNILSSTGTLGTAGDVNVNDVVAWSANKLTLNAQNNININANLNGSGTASLAFEFGQQAVAVGNASNIITKGASVNLLAGTTNLTTKLGSDGVVKNFTVITSLGAAGSTTATDLQGMSGNLAANYALGSDIDATATSAWNAGAGFSPIGNSSTNFSGSFDGLGHVINGLGINRPTTTALGLVGYAATGAVIRNVGLIGGSVSGNAQVGALVGRNNGTVSNSYASGSVTGTVGVGGLVGAVGGPQGSNISGVISNSYATGNVTGTTYVGGLVGGINIGVISNSYATGSVIGSSYVGGLVGSNLSATNAISNSYATGSVSAIGTYGVAGGLVAANVGTVSNSYATGNVSAYTAGGLVGTNEGSVNNTYATGSVSAIGAATSVAGGLVAENLGTVSNSYSTGSVSGTGPWVGGLVGYNYSTVTNGYWNNSVNAPGAIGIGGGTTTGATGLTSTQMRSASSFTGFTFTTTPGASGNNWVNVNASGFLNSSGATYPMLASEYSTTISNAHQLQLMAMATGASYTLGANIDASSTGNGKDVWGSSGFVPVGRSNASFTGTFDGLGHTISNLSINFPTTSRVGLFRIAGTGSVVRNVGLVGGSVSGGGYVGGLVGYNAGGTVSDSYTTGNVSGTGFSIGGLVGGNNSTISNSHATGSVSGGSYVGGLVGTNRSTLSDSYATGSVNGSNGVGGLVGYNNLGTVATSYATGSVTAINGGGGLVGSNAGTVTASHATGSVNAGGYGNAGGLVGWNIGTIGNSYATGSVSTGANGGSGSAGGLVGYSNYSGAISNSYATGSVNTGAHGVAGGLVGTNGGTINSAHATGSVTAGAYGNSGGLVGNNEAGAISDSYATGSVAGQDSVGGLVGNNSGPISGSFATGNASGTGNYIGGLVGVNGGLISTSYATGSVTGASHVGGLAGANGYGISNSYATGRVTASGAYVGGLVGNNDGGTVVNSHATGSVSGGDYVGGLVGTNGRCWPCNNGTVNNSYATGNVSGVSYVGGLLGYNPTGLGNSYATGNVTGTGSYVGGLIGYNDGRGFSNGASISNSYATGSVSGATYVGGLVGVTANYGRVSTSYATGAASGTASVGGLAGSNSGGIVSDSYWNSDATAIGVGNAPGGVNTGATGLSSAQMRTASSFAGFNFTSTAGAAGNNWVIVNADGTLQANASSTAGATYPMLASEYSTSINNAHQLQLMAMAPAASYSLTTSVNASATGNGTDVWGSSGFVPIGNAATQFTGTFDGLDRTVSNLNINQPTADFVGLFGYTGPGSAIRNVGLIGGSVSGHNHVGELVGFGGLSNGGTVSNSYATGSVSGNISIGGLIGSSSGNVSNSYSTGSVGGNISVGGLMGTNYSAISNSYATGNVVGTGNRVGGLVGTNSGTLISNSYATGNLSGAASNIGGLVGATDAGTVSNSYWNTTTSGRATSSGGTGLDTTQMMSQASFSGWDIAGTGGSTAVWRIYEGSTAPLLRGFLAPLTVTANAASQTYNGSAFSGGNGVTFSVANPVLSGSLAYGGNSQGAVNAGSYVLAPSGYFSGQLGYDISYVNGTLTINPANLSAISLNGTRAYDGTINVAASIFTLSGLVSGQDLTLSGVGTVADKNVGINKPVSLGSLLLGNGTNGLASNYTFTGGTQIATITAANLALSTSSVTKTYDGGLTAAGAAVVTGGTLFTGDTLSGGSFAFTDKNAGIGNKTVTASGVTVNDGNSGANYNVSYASNTASTINPYAVNLIGSRTYDGTVNVAAGALAIGALVGTETLALSGAGTVADKNVGTAKVVTQGTLALGDGNNGGLASNYTFTGGTQTASITPASLLLTSANVTKTYDGGLAAAGAVAVTGGTLFTGDTLGGGTFAFTDKNAGSGNKTVTASGVTVNDGNSGANYNVSYASNTASTINPYAVNLTGSRGYDGTANVTAGALAIGALVGTETLALSGTGTFADKNVGTAKAVAQGTLALGDGNNGGLASNYTFTGGTQTADITPASLLLSSVNVTKTYDGGLTAAGTVAVTGGTLFAGDTLSGGTFAFTDKNAGSGNKTVTAGGVTVNDGNGGANYSVGYVSNTASTITTANLAITGVTASKTYDGSTTASVAFTDNRFAGDRISIGYSANFADRNVGIGKMVSVSGLALSGADALNYSLASPTLASSASITQLASVAWNGGTTGDWSNAANWTAGALPDASNVAAVTIPAGASVTYDSAAGTTKLTSLTSQGNLVLAGGNLTLGNVAADNSRIQNATLTLSGAQLSVNGSLQADTLRIVAGAVSGSGNLTSADFGQIGGSIAATLSNLNLASLGNFSLASVLGATQSIELGSGGAILDALPKGTAATVSAPSIQLTAATGIGIAGVPLRVSTTALLARTTKGAIQLENTPNGRVALAGLSTGDASDVFYAQNGRALDVLGLLASQGGAIVLDPPTDVTLNSVIATTGNGSVTLEAANTLVMAPAAAVNSGGGAVGIRAGGKITLAAVNAGSGSATIQSSGGQIGSSTPGVNNVTAGDLTLNAMTGIQLAYVAPAVHVSNTSGPIALTDSRTGVTVGDPNPAPFTTAADTTAVTQTVATVIQQAVLVSTPTAVSIVITPTGTPSPTAPGDATTGSTPSSTPAGTSSDTRASATLTGAEDKPREKAEEKSVDKPPAKPATQTVTVGNSAVRKPADQVVKVDAPKGRTLMCRAK